MKITQRQVEKLIKASKGKIFGVRFQKRTNKEIRTMSARLGVQVNERVRDRVRLRNQKEVHAYISGFLCHLSKEPIDRSVSVRYNPYETDFFTTEHGVSVFTADFADLDCGKSVDINAWNPK